MSSITQVIRQSYNQVFQGRGNAKPSENNQQVPLGIRLTGLFFNLAATVSPGWAAERLSRLWFTVLQPRPKPWIQAFWSQADQSLELHLQDKTVTAYSWDKYFSKHPAHYRRSS